MSVTFNVPNSQAYEENIPCYCLRDECHPDPGCIDCGGKGFWLYKSTKYEINWSNINARTFLIGLYTLAQQDYDVDSDLVGSISIEMLLSLRDKIIEDHHNAEFCNRYQRIAQLAEYGQDIGSHHIDYA